MSLGKKLFIGGTPACTTDTADIFGDGSGIALYSLDYDASDASGNYNGAPSNVTFGVDGQINWGASFNGSSSYIDTNLQMPSTTTFTFSCWFYKNDSANYHLIGDFNSSATLSSGRLRVQLASNGDIDVGVGNGTSMDFSVFTPTVSLTEIWRHIAVTVDGTSVKAYIDGSQVGTTDTSLYSLASGVNNFAIGAYHTASGKQNFNGVIDQVRIFNKALSDSEVTALYGETACVYTSTTDTVDYQGTNVAYYKLDNNAEDAKGNYDGTESNITYEFGRFGQAAVFNGSSSIIKDVLGNGFTYAGKTMTFSAWIFVEDASNDNMIIGDGLVTSTGGWGISTGYGNAPNRSLAFGVASTAMGGVQQTYSSVSVSDNTWTHIAVSVDFSSITDSVKMYINGTEDTSLTDGISGTFVDNTTYNTSIGGTWTGSAGRLFEGKIDQVRIYNSTLDATAVENLYNEKPEVNTSNFETVLYNGTASDRYVSNVGFQPDLVWIKSRGDASSNFLFDVVRGTSNWLSSDLNLGQNSASGVTSFDSNGFTLGNNGAMNSNSQTYVAWCWKGGGNAVNNTDGTLTSTVSANPDAGFSIVKWTNNNAVRTVGHGLNSTPELIIFKRTDTTQNWFVETNAIDGSYDYLVLNSDATKVDGSGAWSTRATSSTITSFTSTTNSVYIAYCFHSVAGYQKIGSYTGGGSSGKTVTTGFRPSWVMIKRTDVSNYWVIIDSVRDTSDPYGQILYANVADAEASGGATTSISFSDTGFSMSTSAVGSSINASGGTYIYIAIA